MPWTRQQIQSFPYRELYGIQTDAQNFERHSHWQRSQPVIQRWPELIAPHTPSESDLASRGVLPNDIAELMIMLLSQTTQEIHHSNIPDIKKILNAWPTIWIWIRLLNGRATQIRKNVSLLSKTQITNERSMHVVLVQALLVLLGYNSPGTQSKSDELTNIVKGTVGVLQMMATLWIEEARDGGGTMGYNSTKIFHGSLSSFRSEMEHLIIAGCGGSANEVAKIASRRIAHNLHRLRYQIDCPAQESPEMQFNLGQDVVFVTAILDQPSSMLYEGFRAQCGWVKAFIDIISYLLSALDRPVSRHLAPGNEKAIIMTSIDAVTLYIDKVQVYGGLHELLESSFLDVLSKVTIRGHKKLDVDQSDHFVRCCEHLIRQIGRFSVYRSMLCRFERDLRDTAISTWMKDNKAPIPMALSDFQSIFSPTYKDFKKGSPPIFCCGNRACKSTDSGDGTLYRCRGCKLALYCGVKCQKQDWSDMHKLLCNAMKQPGQILPPLSSPDLRWFAYLYIRELIQTPFLSSGFTAHDSAGHLTSLPVLCLGIETDVLDLTDQSAVAAGGLIPNGRLREAWRRSLSPRQSRHLHPTKTVAVLILSPPQMGQAHGSMTALFTFPVAEHVKPDKVHVTWIYHQ